MDDLELLKRYVSDQDEQAFAELLHFSGAHFSMSE
jgi:hypothetical protein